MQLEFNLAQTPDFVFEQLSKVEHFIALHPLIYRMDKQAEGQYLVYERAPFLSFIRFRYPAQIQILDKKIEIQAKVFGLVHISMVFELSPQEPKGTKVIENIKIRSYLPVHWNLAWVLKRAHRQLFEAMAAVEEKN